MQTCNHEDNATAEDYNRERMISEAVAPENLRLRLYKIYPPGLIIDSFQAKDRELPSHQFRGDGKCGSNKIFNRQLESPGRPHKSRLHSKIFQDPGYKRNSDGCKTGRSQEWAYSIG